MVSRVRRDGGQRSFVGKSVHQVRGGFFGFPKTINPPQSSNYHPNSKYATYADINATIPIKTNRHRLPKIVHAEAISVAS